MSKIKLTKNKVNKGFIKELESKPVVNSKTKSFSWDKPIVNPSSSDKEGTIRGIHSFKKADGSNETRNFCIQKSSFDKNRSKK